VQPPLSKKVNVEVVCCSVEDCLVAEQAGADRIELCSAIELGGLTPSLGLLEACQARTRLPIVAMLRPRAGGFVYASAELQVMVRDAEHLKAAGADGLALGCLTHDGRIDHESCGQVLQAFSGRPATFHRAFDSITTDLTKSAADLRQLGFGRVLTSGRSVSAVEGAANLKLLVETVSLEVIAAGGVRKENVLDIVQASGAHWIHLGPFIHQEERGYQGQRALKLDSASLLAVTSRLA
jgi:copper homeostasis protein